jgi:hypothetical protein
MERNVAHGQHTHEQSRSADLIDGGGGGGGGGVVVLQAGGGREVANVPSPWMSSASAPWVWSCIARLQHRVSWKKNFNPQKKASATSTFPLFFSFVAPPASKT